MKTILLISAALNVVLLFLLFKKRKKQNDNIASEIDKKDSTNADNQKTDFLQSKINTFKTFAAGLPNETNKHESLLHKLATETQAVQGALYLIHKNDDRTFLRFNCGYAFYCPESKPIEFEMGEGLIGQVAKDKKTLMLNTAPEEHIPAVSGLGKAVPQHLIICPLVKNDIIVGVMELAAFHPFDTEFENFIEAASKIVTETL
ncbi:MAG: GAF domain-containing protein [Bacteroidetes bacterium]|nr:GAF domain-containing protein [Bacteroidota bacterium]